jgi:hypothetical protein
MRVKSSDHYITVQAALQLRFARWTSRLTSLFNNFIYLLRRAQTTSLMDVWPDKSMAVNVHEYFTMGAVALL